MKRLLKNDKNHGITLIALVVTIVVLLILAGITITFVLGEGGILDMAKEAAEKTKNSIANDQSDMTNLAEDIRNLVNGGTTGGGSEPDTLTEAEKEAITIGEAKDPTNFGKEVIGYSANGIEKWRLFYQDENYTYIIADKLVGSYNLETEYVKGDYDDGSKVSTIGQRLNPMLRTAKPNGQTEYTFFDAKNTNDNIKGVAWLTDETKWQDYAAGKALYAIGSPTVELFAASYNAVQITNTLKVEPGTYGYTENSNVRMVQ